MDYKDLNKIKQHNKNNIGNIFWLELGLILFEFLAGLITLSISLSASAVWQMQIVYNYYRHRINYFRSKDKTPFEIAKRNVSFITFITGLIFVIFVFAAKRLILYAENIEINAVGLISVAIIAISANLFINIRLKKLPFSMHLVWAQLSWTLSILVGVLIWRVDTLWWIDSLLASGILVWAFAQNQQSLELWLKKLFENNPQNEEDREEIREQIEIQEEVMQPQIRAEVFGIADEVSEKIFKVEKVEDILTSKVWQIEEQEITTMQIIVANTTTQEELYNIKAEVRKILNEYNLDSVIELLYTIEALELTKS